MNFGIMTILYLVIQVGLIVHVFKTGRSIIWIFLLLFLPIVAPIAYFVVEILPELMGSRTARRTALGFKKAIDPGADLRRLEQEARMTANVASRQRYADELVVHGRFDEAIAQYRSALTGLYTHDPKLLLGIARAQFGKGDASAARSSLDELTRENPDFQSPECQLLYARALESEGNVQQALQEYAALAGSYPGAEAAVRYAQLLSSQGMRAEAQRVARELLDQARIAPAHYRKAQRSWLDSAERLSTQG